MTLLNKKNIYTLNFMIVALRIRLCFQNIMISFRSFHYIITFLFSFYLVVSGLCLARFCIIQTMSRLSWDDNVFYCFQQDLLSSLYFLISRLFYVSFLLFNLCLLVIKIIKLSVTVVSVIWFH